MDDGGPTASMILFFLLIVADVFFFGFDSAVRHLNQKDVEEKAEEGSRRAERLLFLTENPSEYINAMQLVLTLLHLFIGFFCLSLWETVTERICALVVLLYIVLTFGVILPRRIAARAPMKWAYGSAGPVWLLTKLFSPVTGLAALTVKLLLGLFGIRVSLNENDVTEEELLDMVNEGHEQGILEDSEAEMITNIIEFGDKEAGDIMTHRNYIVGIDGTEKLQDAISFMLAGRSSRYPVYEENIDNIVGILYLKDAMRFHMNEENRDLPIKDLDGLLRDAHFVPETKNIDELFREMQSRHLQMVIVVDEYGQTEGLVTMEDILEEIVGNILDEYDEDDQFIREKGNDEYVIEGITPLKDLEERFGIDFEAEEVETLNGYLISRLDRLPEENENFGIDVQGYHFQILSVENKMIASVLVKKLPEDDEGKQMKENKER